VSWRPSASLATLRARARLLEEARAFFHRRGVLEVDPPPLQGGANLDRGVDPVAVDLFDGRRYLATSPEHFLKRLLAAGYGDVWSCTPCVRDGEHGRLHAPCFSMLEWYRLDSDDHRLAEETIELLDRLTGLGTTHRVVPYRTAFLEALDLDPATATDDELHSALGQAADAVTDRLERLDLLLATRVQPGFLADTWTVVTDWPADQAAQARLRGEPAVAARFEIYRGAVEIANGYHECTDGEELTTRLRAEQAGRTGDRSVLRDERFETAMAAGLPDCSGVAVGFDRVVMLALGLPTVAEAQAFAWDRA